MAGDVVSEPAPEALEGFIGKWRARWPEWAIAEAFVAQAEREAALAWAALQQELTDAAWGGSDPRPGEVKLGWWQEELQGWGGGRRRHPLGLVLMRRDAPWARLGAALPMLTGSRERPRDADEAFELLRPFAAAVAAVDAALFAGTGAGEGGDPLDPMPVIATLLAARLARGGDVNVPLSALAGAASADAGVAWRLQLAGTWPACAGTPRPRRLWAALAHARLRQIDPAVPLPPWRALAVAWRAARADRN